MSQLKSVKADLINKAGDIFRNNLHEGYSEWTNSNFKYISPAKKEYVFQWLWDTAFHAIVLSHFDTKWAKSEITNFLLGQREDGFLPHIIFWGNKKILPHWAYIESELSLQPRVSSITQPPLLALAVETIYRRDQDLSFLYEVLPKIAKFHRWLLENRDPDGDYLLSIISANESGLDELPVFQYALGYKGNDAVKLHYYFRKPDFLNQVHGFENRTILAKDYFNVEELMFNCVFIEASRSLSRLYSILEKDLEASFFFNTAKKSEEALLEKCWSDKDGIFYSLFSKKEKQASVKTISSLMPLFLDGLRGEKLEALIGHLHNTDEFWTKYPVPSVSKDEHYYEPEDTPTHKLKLIWRGPTWINTNWFIVKGLRKHGYYEIADEIVAKMMAMIKKNGFREYYNPETGVGYRHHNFGWSTLIIDLL